jgi:hypothetical protein
LSSVNRVFTNSPTNQSVWMIVLGAVFAIIGLVLAIGGGRGTRA